MKSLIVGLVLFFMLSAAAGSHLLDQPQETNKPYLSSETYYGSELETVMESVKISFTKYSAYSNTEETRQKILEEYTEFFLLIVANYDIISDVTVICDETNNVTSGTESSVIRMTVLLHPEEFRYKDAGDEFTLTVTSLAKET